MPLYAQQIKGVVLDADDEGPIPYATVAYKGNHIAVSCNGDGEFVIDRHNGWRMTISSVGYDSQFINVTGATPNTLKIRLKANTQKIDEVYVRSKKSSKYSRKNNPAVEFMRKVIAAKKKTNLKNHDFYQYNNYQKITLGLNDIKPNDLESGMFKKHKWLVDQVEMCEYNNKLILPVSVDETVTQKLYRKDPHDEKSIIQGQASNGINDLFQTGDILNTTMKDVFTDIDIYNDEVRLLQYPFTSTIGKDAIAFYHFYLTDTTYVGQDRCILVDFFPNNPQDFGFRGQLYVLADSSYQVRRCELMIPQKSDVNWVENMRCTQEFVKLPNGEWVLSVDDMMAELYFAKFLRRFVVIRNTRRSDFAFEEISKQLFRGKKEEVKNSYAEMRDDAFWNQYRQVELTKSESSIDQFIHHLEQLKGFKYIIFGMKALIENFVETGTKEHPSKVDIGPINTMISQNFYDGMRFRASAQTTANLNPHLFLKGYYAYGTKTKNHYYDAEVIWSLNKKEYLPREFPKQTLTFATSRDVAMPSDKFIQTDKDNVFTSFKWGEQDKMFIYNKQELNFEYEKEWGFKFNAGFKTERVDPVGNISFTKIADNSVLSHIRYSEATIGIRYAPGETFINTKQHRWPINLDAPVFRLTHTMGFKNILGGQYNYNMTEAEVYKRIWMPQNFGKIDVRIKAGAQWNKVPYPLLIMPVANLSYILEEQTFNLVNNMEFLNDRYASLDASWDMNGKILNRIPLLRRLKWREYFGVKMLWGHLTDKNNPTLEQNQNDNILMQFPEGCHIMDKHQPYVELIAGVHNIFKLLHVEYVRRLNYLNLATANKHGIRLMIRVTF